MSDLGPQIDIKRRTVHGLLVRDIDSVLNARERVAEIQGRSISDFLVAAAQAAAHRTIEDEHAANPQAQAERCMRLSVCTNRIGLT